MSIITDVDSYKVGMFKQYPPKTEYVSSYIESRRSDEPDFDESVFFGLEYYIKEYLMKPVTMEDLEEAKEIFDLHGEPFPYDEWKYIIDEYDGYLPLKIESVLEGSVLPLSNVLVQITNTDPKCFWLTTWVETPILRNVWYASTVATNSRAIKKELKKFYDKSGSVDGLDFKLHDFGARGVSSKESAGLGGLAHLINFMGTDNVEALMFGRKYYNILMAGFSIPASEHSTITAWGIKNENKAFENMLNQFPDYPIIACVSDSYNIYKAVDELWGKQFKHRILDGNQTIVIRPDSGDPLTVPIEVIERLMAKFGYSVNSKGYKTLPKQVRVIQGDGITKDSIKLILGNMEKAKLTLDNLSFGMGSGMLQQVNRDTLKYAMKANAICIDGVWSDVYKDPINGGKQSKRGVLGLYHNENDGWITERKLPNDESFNNLNVVYDTGIMKTDTLFKFVRQRARIE